MFLDLWPRSADGDGWCGRRAGTMACGVAFRLIRWTASHVTNLDGKIAARVEIQERSERLRNTCFRRSIDLRRAKSSFLGCADG
jgi:hypothetical protein